jgi:ADP-ribosylglycohydrolase
MTIAVADALMNSKDPAVSMREWARKVQPSKGVGGYGKKFFFWLAAPIVLPPYNSFGNGGAMRVSPAAFFARSLGEALDMARKVTEVTHNHHEGLKGALATAHAIYLALNGEAKKSIRLAISDAYQYNLSRNIDEIRQDYKYTESAQGSVPESLICALDAVDYEDSIRNAVSLGGDADTMAAIAGGLAEAMFGIPANIKSKGLEYLPVNVTSVLEQMYLTTK